MAKKANPKLIGIFILVAVALLVAGIVIFGSGRFFQEKQRYVLFFEGSIKGLDIGAPVILKGVQIGQVTGIKVVYDPELWSFQSPVHIELFPKRIADVKLSEEVSKLYGYERGTQEMIDLFVQRGLRGQLEMQSFVTGKLMVALDFHPGTAFVADLTNSSSRKFSSVFDSAAILDGIVGISGYVLSAPTK